MEERAESTRFLEEKPSFYFPAGAEAGPAGKCPAEAKAGKYLRLYKKYFINSLKRFRAFSFAYRGKYFFIDVLCEEL
jgi:hypothetical protein